MALNLAEINKISQSFDKRLTELRTAAWVLSQLKSANDYTRAGMVELIIKNSGTRVSQEMKSLVPVASKLIADMIKEIPPEVIGKVTKFDAEAAALHSQLKVGVQQLLLADKAAENIGGLMSVAKDNLHGDAGRFAVAVTGMVNTAAEFLDGFQSAVGSTSGMASFSKILKKRIPDMKTAISEARQKTVELQSRIFSGGDFSPQRIAAIKDPLELAASVVPQLPTIASIFSPSAPPLDIPTTPALEALMPSGIVGSATSALSSILGASFAPSIAVASGSFSKNSGVIANNAMVREATDLVNCWSVLGERIKNLSTFKDDLVANIKPGDLFKSNFSHMYNIYKSIFSDIDQASARFANDSTPGNAAAAMQSINSALAKMRTIVGLIQTLGNKKFQAAINDKLLEPVQKISAFSGQLTNFLSPGGTFDQVKNAVNNIKRDATIATRLAERLLKGKVPQVSTLLALKDRLMSSANTVQSGVTTFRNILNTFDMKPTANVNAFMATVGVAGHAGGEAVIQGNAVALAKTLQSPSQITFYGQAIESLKSLASSMPGITVEQRSVMSSVMSILAGWHKRQVSGMWLANIPVQRSQALKEIDIFAGQLNGAKTLLNTLAEIVQTAPAAKTVTAPPPPPPAAVTSMQSAVSSLWSGVGSLFGQLSANGSALSGIGANMVEGIVKSQLDGVKADYAAMQSSLAQKVKPSVDRIKAATDRIANKIKAGKFRRSDLEVDFNEVTKEIALGKNTILDTTKPFLDSTLSRVDALRAMASTVGGTEIPAVDRSKLDKFYKAAKEYTVPSVNDVVKKLDKVKASHSNLVKAARLYSGW